MYLSRVELSGRAARNPYDIHRRLWTLFPDQPHESRKDAPSPRQGFLFRVEEQHASGAVRALVQSRWAPIAANEVTVVACREVAALPQSGQTLAFLLTANPVKTIVDMERESKPDKAGAKCRVPLLREDEQIQWLTRKLGSAAEVLSPIARGHAPLHFRKGGQPGKVAQVTFEGLLRVLDSRLLLTQMENGIGPAKAFGCGLLLVRRLG
jgi:CRISPR system Cascade subunit CasE